MRGIDRLVLGALQGLVLLLPLFLGGRQTTAVAAGCFVVIVLLFLTARERRRRAESAAAPGLLALAGFSAWALLSTVPLPPWLLESISPATADLYARTLPGWPEGGAWTSWRPLAISPYEVATALSKLSIGLGAFAVIVAFPWRVDAWREEEPRAYVVGRLLFTVLLGGVLVAALGLIERGSGNGFVMWITDEFAPLGRASGPFVNPNHYAAWLEMVIPIALAYTLALVGRMYRRIAARAQAGRGMGVRARRAWVSALVAHQQKLWPSLVAAVGVFVLVIAHAASESRGGRAALLAGLAVAAVGLLVRAVRADAARPLGKWTAVVAPAALVAAAIASAGLWAATQSEVAASGMDAAGDMSLGARLAAASLTTRIVADFPWTGTGLGSFLHAFRPYQAPPLETGILDHAHNDYLELAAETGLLGVAFAALFAIAVIAALTRRRNEASSREVAPWTHRGHGEDRPAGFEVPEWRLALREQHIVRWGIAGGVAAVLVHSLVDFGLRMPANLLLFMVLLGILVLAAGPGRPARAHGLVVVLAVFVLAAVPQVANRVLVAADRAPLSPADAVERAELLMAEEGEEGQPRAIALVERAIDGSPAFREAHEVHAQVLGPGPEGDDALRRALAIHPWSVEVRDDLGLRLWSDGKRADGAAELEESMRRYPWFPAHTYLTYPEEPPTEPTAAEAIRKLTEPDELNIQLAALDPEMAAAIERGLRRALNESFGGATRAGIVDQLATLLELRGRYADAGALLEGAANSTFEPTEFLARAARNYLKAEDDAAAEKALLAAVLSGPDQGVLYRQLAVKVYAPRGDFDTAAAVLAAAQQNAIDLMPVYEGVTEVLEQRKAAERSQGLPVAGLANVSIEEVAP
jgi:O-antigen ligase